jgi:hypothetical protein
MFAYHIHNTLFLTTMTSFQYRKPVTKNFLKNMCLYKIFSVTIIDMKQSRWTNIFNTLYRNSFQVFASYRNQL